MPGTAQQRAKALRFWSEVSKTSCVNFGCVFPHLLGSASSAVWQCHFYMTKKVTDELNFKDPLDFSPTGCCSVAKCWCVVNVLIMQVCS